MKGVGDLLNTKTDLQKTQENEYVFAAVVDGEEIKLRLNSFPEEPLCTLICGAEEQDLDD